MVTYRDARFRTPIYGEDEPADTRTRGEPGWLAAIERGGAALIGNQWLAASIVLAIALAVIAVGVDMPPPAAKATLVLAIVLAARR